MSGGAALRFVLLGSLLRALPALIHTQRLVMATVGDEVILNCVLSQPKDVLQVTWQRIFPWGERNLATCNKYFGQKVNAAFRGKVEVQASGLRNSSIVINSVTEQDDGCYHCLFNAYPEGALTGKTCLQVHEPQPPKPQKIVSLTLEDEAPAEGADDEFSSDNGGLSVTVISVVVSFSFLTITIIILGTVVFVIKRQNSKSHRDTEKVMSPQRPLQPVQQTHTPSNPPGSGQLRQRPSTAKREAHDRRKASSPPAGCKRQLDMLNAK